jgi:thymidine kinase
MAKLYFYYASMNAGKSTTLLQADFNYRERGMTTMLWTAAVDDRGGEHAIESRIGLHAQAHRFTPETDMYAAIAPLHGAGPVACVLVDEAQFLTAAQVWQLARLADEANVPVLCYGLRTDFRGAVPRLGGAAGHCGSLIELKAVCHCGRKAIMNLRVDETGRAVIDGAQTEIGGNDRYVALCRKHFSEARA